MFGYGGYGGGYGRWLWIRWRVCFNYSIVYLVNYHWCSYLELKKALIKGLFLSAMGLLYLLCCLFY